MATHSQLGFFQKEVLSTILLAVPASGIALTFSLEAQPEPTPQPVRPVDPDIAQAIAITDAEAALRIEDLLRDELKVTQLHARVIDGVATLEGTVRGEDDRRRAAAMARDVAGIVQVINELEVDATSIDDPPLGNGGSTLEAAVTSQLRRDPVLASRDIRVVADRRSNTVTLIGEVNSEAESQRARRVAEDAFAAGHVRNRLQIRRP